ncbi:MAG: ATP-binding cassette domain-containing protein [Eubacteriales bacterium]|nr:ATP-binding cassette domain-containing protein [Eubacteriales bacterium]
MGETVISIKNINKNYGKHKVLTDVSLDIEKGDIFGLVGKNGAGKTTLFKVILGLSDYQGGSLQIGSDPAHPLDGRKNIGFFVGNNLFPNMTGRENLEYYRRLKGIKDKNEVSRVLEIVDLANAKGPVKSYSLGMRQRLGMANSIMGDPDILILDEPVNGLDPQGIADIRNLIKKMNEEHNMTVIVSSHILGELQNTAHKFGIINNGSVARVVTDDELRKLNSVVRIRVDELDKAREVLAAAGVNVLEETQETRSLEDFYFDIVGRK